MKAKPNLYYIWSLKYCSVCLLDYNPLTDTHLDLLLRVIGTTEGFHTGMCHDHTCFERITVADEEVMADPGERGQYSE